MKTTPPNSVARALFSALRLTAGLGLATLVYPSGVQAQLPITSVDAAWSVNGDGSWGTVGTNWSQTSIATATVNTAPRVGTAVSTVANAITFTNRGSGYTSPPAVTIAPPPSGTQATAVATITAGGVVSSIVVTNGGSGYTVNPVVTIAPPTTQVGGVGSSVTFYTDINPNRVITLDGDRTVGRMTIGDLSSSQTYTLEQGTGGSLIFNNAGSGGGAFLSKIITGGADVISAPVVLNDQLNVRVVASRLTISGKITGNGNTITSHGNGLLSLTGNNSDSNFDLWLWNKGSANANAQVELGATTGNAVGGNIIIGNASRGTGGHAVLQLLQGRSYFDQISDSATVMFESFSTSGRNNYFKLMGASETVGTIVDLGGRAIIENRESESVSTGATLRLAGNGNSYVSGFIRDANGTNLAQADAAGTVGANALALDKAGTGNLTLQGGNIIFTGGLTVSGGSVNLIQTTNFRSDVTNNGNLIFDTGTLGTTSVWNFRKTFADTNLDPLNLLVRGTGSVEKTGQAILTLGPRWTESGNVRTSNEIGGTLTVRNGTLNLTGIGTGTQIGAGLVVTGDSGLVKNVNLYGKTTINGGINATGRFNNTNSAIRVEGAVFSNGDQKGSIAEAGVLTVNGPIRLNYMDLRLGGDVTVAKTTSGGASLTTKIRLTDSSSVTVGMRVTSNSTTLPVGTVVTAVNPATREITLNNSVTISSGTALNFTYDSNDNGILNGNVTGITIIGRPLAISATVNAGSLLLNNSQFSNNTNRIPDATPITLMGGQIELANDFSSNAFSERLGGVTLREGNSQILVHQAGGTGTSVLTLSALTRNKGTTVEFGARGADAPITNISGALGVNQRASILINSGVAMDDGIIGGWAYSGYEFVKYGAFGVTQLTTTDYVTVNPTVTSTASPSSNTWIYNANVKVGANTSSMSLAGKVAINSLNIKASTTTASNRAMTLAANAILSIESGGLLSSNGSNTITGNGSTGYVTVGTAVATPAELLVTVGTTVNTASASTLTMNTAIRDFVFQQAAAGVTMANASNTMTVPGNLHPLLMVGMSVSGTNIPAGTTISSITRTAGGTTITLSNAASGTVTSSAANPVTFKGGALVWLSPARATFCFLKRSQTISLGLP